jgi:TM2 domain-containing membrane protein YozV
MGAGRPARLRKPPSGYTSLSRKEAPVTATVLWIIAAILVIVGIVQLIQGQIILGIVLIVLGCLVGPGGYSIFRTRRA